MHRDMKRIIVYLSLAAMTAGVPTLALAGPDLKPMPINAPVPINAVDGWQGHWAKPDLDELRSRGNILPEVFASGYINPNDAMPIGSLADVLTSMYGFGGEPGDALDRAVKLGLIRSADFAGGEIRPDQPVSRQFFALLLTRALGINGAEDGAGAQTLPTFSDAAEIQAKYQAAVAIMQAEGLLVGSGDGRFAPADSVTYAQAARTMVKASAWVQARVAKIAGLNAAEAAYLIDGQKITLSGGKAEEPAAPGSALMAVTRLTDRLAAGDLNGDGQIDVAAVLTYQGGGSGTFYYLTAMLHDGTPVEAAFLGDRIAVQNVRMVDGKVAVDMLTRGADEPMAVRPHIKETRTFALKDGALVAYAALDPANATYLIDGQKVTLVGGKAEQQVAPGSATKAVTQLTDKLATGDLNGDGQVDVAAVLTYQGGGSGTFYYLGAVLHDGTPVEAAFLGDRIAVENVQIANGKVIVDMLTRGADEPMVVKPHIKEIRTFELKDGALVPVPSLG